MKHVFGIFLVLTVLALSSCNTTDSSSKDVEPKLIIDSASAIYDNGDVLVEITSDSALALLVFNPLDSNSNFALDDKVIGEENADNTTKFSTTLHTKTTAKICNQEFQVQIRGFSVSQYTEIKKNTTGMVDDDFYPEAAFVDTVNIVYNTGYVCDTMGESKKAMQFPDTTFGEVKDTVSNSADLTIDGSNGAVSGTVSANEAFWAVTLTPEEDDSPFDTLYILNSSENLSSLTLDDTLTTFGESCKGSTYNFGVNVLTVAGAEAAMANDLEVVPISVGSASITLTKGLDCDENGTRISSLEFSDTLILGSYAASAPSWVDADDMTAYLNAEAKAISAKIDLMFVNEAEGGLFFMSPFIAAAQRHASSTWDKVNSTKFVKVDKDLTSVLNQAELKALWSNAAAAKDQKTYALAVNDVVLLETDQGKIVAIKVIELNERTSNDGKDTALVIGTLGDKTEVAEPAE